MALIASLILLALGAACSSGPDGEETQPAPEPTVFVEGDFGDIPLPGRAEPIGPRSEDDGVVTASWSVRNMAPEMLVRWYADELGETGWDDVRGPLEYGEDIWRGAWTNDGRLLEVVADNIQASRPDSDTEYGTQLSLVLHPDTAVPPVDPQIDGPDASAE